MNKSNTVEMIIALDRSTSMQQHPFDSMPSRLQAAQQAIPTAINNHQRIRFGLELFPGSSDCNNSAACCAGQVFFSAAPHQSTSIATQMGCGPGDAGCPIAGDDSPSPLALNQCNAAFAKEGPQREGDLSRFVLLVTDRDPTCAGDLSQGTNPCGVATDEASKLGEYVGVQIFVVALNSDGQSTGCLKQIANANAHNFGDDQQFFPATKQTELDQRLGDIMTRAEAPLCGFFLGLGGPNDPDQLEVTVGGTPILPYTSDGWSFSDPYTIVLSGSSCADVMDGQTVTVTTCSPS